MTYVYAWCAVQSRGVAMPELSSSPMRFAGVETSRSAILGGFLGIRMVSRFAQLGLSDQSVDELLISFKLVADCKNVLEGVW